MLRDEHLEGLLDTYRYYIAFFAEPINNSSQFQSWLKENSKYAEAYENFNNGFNEILKQNIERESAFQISTQYQNAIKKMFLTNETRPLEKFFAKNPLISKYIVNNSKILSEMASAWSERKNMNIVVDKGKNRNIAYRETEALQLVQKALDFYAQTSPFKNKIEKENTEKQIILNIQLVDTQLPFKEFQKEIFEVIKETLNTLALSTTPKAEKVPEKFKEAAPAKFRPSNLSPQALNNAQTKPVKKVLDNLVELYNEMENQKVSAYFKSQVQSLITKIYLSCEGENYLEDIKDKLKTFAKNEVQVIAENTGIDAKILLNYCKELVDKASRSSQSLKP